MQLGGGCQQQRRRPPHLKQRRCGGICIAMVQLQNFGDSLGLQRGECATQSSTSGLQVGGHAPWEAIVSMKG